MATSFSPRSSGRTRLRRTGRSTDPIASSEHRGSAATRRACRSRPRRARSIRRLGTVARGLADSWPARRSRRADTAARSGRVEVESDVVLTGGASGVVLTPEATRRRQGIVPRYDDRVRRRRRRRLHGRRENPRASNRNGAVIDVIATGAGVTKNGNPVSSGERLRYGDIIAIDSSATWVVDATPRGSLAYSRERNGQAMRAIMPTTPALVARLDSLLADGLRLRSREAASDVALTLDRAAIDAVQRGLDRRCAEAASGGVRQCSAMLVDAETGDILAFADWAKPDVRVSKFAALDQNFRNHRSASTIKPFIAAAVLNEYPSLKSLVVEHPAERFASAAGWPLGFTTPMKSELHGCPRVPVTWDCFIPNSNNLYAVTLGFLGAAERGANGMPALGGIAEGPVVRAEWRTHGAAAQIRGEAGSSDDRELRRSRISWRRCSMRGSGVSSRRVRREPLASARGQADAAHESAVAARVARRAVAAAGCATILGPPLPRRVHDRREREQLEQRRAGAVARSDHERPRDGAPAHPARRRYRARSGGEAGRALHDWPRRRARWHAWRRPRIGHGGTHDRRRCSTLPASTSSGRRERSRASDSSPCRCSCSAAERRRPSHARVRSWGSCTSSRTVGRPNA